MDNVIQNLDLQQQGLWFPLAISAVALFFILLMPKRQIDWRRIYLTFGVVGYVVWMLDISVAGYLDIFDLGDPAKEGLGDLVTFGIIPSCLAVAYLNYFDRKSKWLYVALFTLISFLFEWGLTKVGYMRLKNWQPWYSIPAYMLVYGLWLPWHFELMQKTCTIDTAQHLRNKQSGAAGLAVAQPVMKPLDKESENQDQ